MKYCVFKRLIDIIISLTSLIVLSPVLLLISMIIKLDSKGSVIFKQERIGKNNKKFVIYKFRTMKDKTDDKNRVTKVGRLLRPYGLDELPQIVNILKGDMSFIGPRPLIIKHLNYLNDSQKMRHNVLPGIIGEAVVEKDFSIIESLKKDVDYVQNISFKTDLKIICLFFKNIIKIFKERKQVENKNAELKLFSNIETLKEAKKKEIEEKTKKSYLDEIFKIPKVNPELNKKMDKLLDLLENTYITNKNLETKDFQMQRKYK